MINAKKKGNKGENNFANYLQENGVKAYRNSASGATLAKGDIHNGLDMTIEVKTVKRLNVQEAWKQVKRDSELASNVPLLAIHFDNMPEKKWLIVMDCDNWLEAVKEKKVELGQITNDRSMEWALKGLKEAVNKVVKYL